jgi:hypothetical protein
MSVREWYRHWSDDATQRASTDVYVYSPTACVQDVFLPRRSIDRVDGARRSFGKHAARVRPKLVGGESDLVTQLSFWRKFWAPFSNTGPEENQSPYGSDRTASREQSTVLEVNERARYSEPSVKPIVWASYAGTWHQSLTPIEDVYPSPRYIQPNAAHTPEHTPRFESISGCIL